MSVTDFDVACLMQRGAVVILGLEDEETSKKHTRTQLEEIVARETATLREALERIEPEAKEIIDIMRRNGFVIDNLDDRWQKLAFTIYSHLVHASSIARNALASD